MARIFIVVSLLLVVGSAIFLAQGNIPKNNPISAPTTNSVATSTALGKTVIITMDEAGFHPATITIAQGDTVTFKNTGKFEHWPASNIHPTHLIYPEFDPKRGIPAGESWSFQFNKAGAWKMHDHLQAEHTGLITVNPSLNIPKSSGVISSSTLAEAAAVKKLEERIQKDRAYFAEHPAELTTAFQATNIRQVAHKPDDLRYWIEIMGAQKVMTKLLVDSGGGSLQDCHQEAHLVGRTAFELYGAAVFGVKDAASCHSGFYHGAMESFLKEKGTFHLAENIDALCNQFSTSFGKFECLHGVGHGVMAYEDYDLLAALKDCNKLQSSYNQTSCYGGVFMENVVTGQGIGADPDHTTKWVSKDPQFPCNAIGSDYPTRYQCYQMQTSWMLTLENYNFDKVRMDCLGASTDMIPVCFKSFGRDAAGNTLRNPEKIVAICGKIQENDGYYDQCISGALNVIVDFWGGTLQNQASELCKLIPESHKPACYSVLASRLVDIASQSAQRKPICDTFESAYQNLCSTL